MLFLVLHLLAVPFLRFIKMAFATLPIMLVAVNTMVATAVTVRAFPANTTAARCMMMALAVITA